MGREFIPSSKMRTKSTNKPLLRTLLLTMIFPCFQASAFIEQKDRSQIFQENPPQIKEEINNFGDFKEDSSYQKFLDDHHPFNDSAYIPEDLITIHSDFTYNKGEKYKLRKEASENFATMARAFQHHFKGKKRLSISSAYRSYSHQKQLTKNCHSHHCAHAGSSEHQAGLAIDVGVNGNSVDKKSMEWLKEHAHLYGFHNSYQKGIEIDGKIAEPRHRRYLGKEFASHLYQKKQSFTQWYYIHYPQEQEYRKDCSHLSKNFDLCNDFSYQKFLDESHPFNQKDYEPHDLTKIKSDFITNGNTHNYKLRKEVASKFADLAWAFQHHFKGKRKITLFSAYRSYKYQQGIINRGCKTTACASPGTSEHQAGLTIDIKVNGRDLNDQDLQRLRENAHRYGFTNSYQRGVKLDGKIKEPRHRRYVGKELASLLIEEKKNFTQRYYELENATQNHYTGETQLYFSQEK